MHFVRKSQLSIRRCEWSDLASLVRSMGEATRDRHVEHLRSQEQGESIYLVGWIDGQVVGHVEIRWVGSIHHPVAAQFPKTPEIRRLLVVPGVRGRGVGTELLKVAELLVSSRSFETVGLVVSIENHGAHRLYERLGYQQWDKGSFESSMGLHADGVTRFKHLVTCYTKDLQIPAVA